jgi:4-alpha-glucanotransferase
MNTPATTDGNWAWRVLPDQISPALAAELAKLSALYGRVPAPQKSGATN